MTDTRPFIEMRDISKAFGAVQALNKVNFTLGPGEILGTRQSGEIQFRVATPELVQELAPVATSDAQLLLDRDGGLAGPRGQAARICLYLFERDQAVGLIRSG